MRFLKYISALVPLFLTPNNNAFAADQNGYTAQYECRAGGTYCNVDVNNLANRACDQTITPSMPWSSINWSNNTICLEAGDHTSKGTLTVPNGTNGSPNNYKVLRYYRSDDNNDDPWNQGSNQAKVLRLQVNDSDYWLIHRLTFPPHNYNDWHVMFYDAVQNVIVNRILIEGPGSNDVCQHGTNNLGNNSASAYITVQNSVVRNLLRCTFGSPVGISFEAGTNHRIVNNQVYNWSEHEIQTGNDNIPWMDGTVVENNDVYKDSAIYDQYGNACGGWLISTKARSSTGSSPVQIIHNRMSGARPQSSACGTPDSGHATGGVSNTNGRTHQYFIWKNNIITDSHGGMAFYNFEPQQESVIGNIFYDIGPKGTTPWSYVMSLYSVRAIEIYFNTIIGARKGTGSGILGEWNSGQEHLDIRCNAFLDSDASSSVVPAATSVADNSVFYSTPPLSFNGTNSNITHTIATRANNSFYNAGTVMRRTPNLSSCTAGDDPNCFLYVAVNTGNAGDSEPAYTVTLGGTFQDGGITWRAIRGPYVYHRKLRTGAVEHVIPYARIHSGAPEAYACPADYASRRGVGINDEM